VSSTFTRKLENLSNIAVVVAAIVVCVVLVRNQLHPNEQPNPLGSPSSFEGKTIDLAGITAAPAERNVLLALSQTCHFCEEEMPFYRHVSEAAAQASAQVHAVFPPGQAEPEKFLSARSVRTDSVVTHAFEKLGVRGTPTLLVVDAHGKIERAWVGALSPAQEKEVLQVLQRGS
jgi:hypothetical protein